MRAALLALLFLTPEFALAAPGGPLAEIDACVDRLDPGLDVGFERIAERCPRLAATLKDSSYGVWLPRDWDRRGNQLSRAGLRDLKTLLLREDARTTAPQLSVAAVPSILATLATVDEPRTLWQRFKGWLHRLLNPPPQQSQQSWLQRLFAQLQISASVWRSISWVSLALVVALAVAVIVNELRAAGVWNRRTSPTRATQLARGAQLATLAEIAHAEPSEQPRLLLEIIATRLTAQARLPQPRSLTVRELTSAARLPDPLDRARLSDLAGACEQLRYSDRALAPSVLAGALTAGRELLAALEAVSASQPQGA